MRANPLWLTRVAKLGLLLMMGVSMSADAGLFGGASWKEEVLLHDGSKIIVERSQSRGGRHDIDQEVPVAEHMITFVIPQTNEIVQWKSTYGWEMGHDNLQPLLLDFLRGVPYIAATIAGCTAYKKWKRPNPPYVLLKYEGEWKPITLAEFPAEFKTPNVVINMQQHETKLVSQGVVSAELVKELNGSIKQPEYKTILREALQPRWDSLTGCPIPTGPDGKPIVAGPDGKPLSNQSEPNSSN